MSSIYTMQNANIARGELAVIYGTCFIGQTCVRKFLAM